MRKVCYMMIVLVLLATPSLTFPSLGHTQETYTSSENMGSLLNQQNQALIHKIISDARVTRAQIGTILPHGKSALPVCGESDILHWHTTSKTWQCRQETDPKAKPFAKANLPVCGANAFLYPSNGTLTCITINTKGSMGPAPTWQWSGDGSSLNVMKADGTWSGWVYLRGDSGGYHRWYAGGWSGCSNGCGNGTQTRAVQCRRNNVNIVADSFCAGTRPTSTQACTSYAGCSYSWQANGWSGCSTSCGDGVQTRVVWCRRSDGVTVSDSYCGGGKPATQQGCHAGYSYSYGNWGGFGSCSKSCGGGTQARTRSCIRCDGVGVDCSHCGGACSQSQSCNTQACYEDPGACECKHNGTQICSNLFGMKPLVNGSCQYTGYIPCGGFCIACKSNVQCY